MYIPIQTLPSVFKMEAPASDLPRLGLVLSTCNMPIRLLRRIRKRCHLPSSTRIWKKKSNIFLKSCLSMFFTIINYIYTAIEYYL